MGRFKRQDKSVNGGPGPHKTKLPKAKKDSAWNRPPPPPETPEAKFKRLRSTALIMARRFGIREWGIERI
jgi:hypothetical protein